MIGIIDYGIGNLRSVQKALQKVGGETTWVKSPSDLATLQGLVLPGVGNFGDCVRGLRGLGMWEAVQEWVKQDKPFFGICVGYQMLFDGSEEAPEAPGLGIIPGRVVKFVSSDLKIPQIGWNQIKVAQASPFLREIHTGDYVYFVHSYYPQPSSNDETALTAEYGIEFACASVRGNMFATQFHPEKSQKAGLQLLQNFVELTKT